MKRKTFDLFRYYTGFYDEIGLLLRRLYQRPHTWLNIKKRFSFSCL